MDYLVTTSDKAKAGTEAQAERLAGSFGLPYQERKGRTLQQLREEANQGVFVLDKQGLLTFYGDPPFSFHPSMARLRIMALVRGEGDRLIDLTRVSSGWSVLDCTAGLCSDSAVFSYAVGPHGKVVALEASPVVYLVTNSGLANYPFSAGEEREAFHRVQLHHANYRQYLAAAAPSSFDLVYFDPMFGKPILTSSGIEPLRPVACYNALTLHDIEQALAAARILVVVKGSTDSPLWESLAPKKLVISKGSSIAYGIFKP